MSFRLMQVLLPAVPEETLDELFAGGRIVCRWPVTQEPDYQVIHLLATAGETEPIMDRLEQAFNGDDRFRVVLLPVEAVIPRPETAENDVHDTANGEEANDEDIAEPGRVSREELYNDIGESLGLNRVFLAMTLLSSVVAAVGLLRDDVAVIVGAMVIAPLLGPNMGMAFAVTLGDVPLLRRALLTNIVGVALSLLVSVAAGMFIDVDAQVPAIEQRTRLSPGDLVLALAAGSAGTFAFTRGLSGAVIGVMVAVALVPPLVVFGMLLGSGHYGPSFGALLLVGTNVVGINLAGVATFVLQGVRPRTWWEGERARKSTRLAIAIWLALLALLAGLLVLNLRGHRLRGDAGMSDVNQVASIGTEARRCVFLLY